MLPKTLCLALLGTLTQIGGGSAHCNLRQDGDLGLAFDSINQRKGQDIVIEFETTRKQIQASSFAYRKVSSRDEYLSFRGSSLEIKLGKEQSLQFKNSNTQIETLSKYAHYLCISCGVIEYSEEIRSPKVRKEPLALLASNMDHFFRIYGDCYVSSVIYGRRLEMAVEFKCESAEQFQASKAEIGVAAEKLTAGASWQDALATVKETKIASATATIDGAPGIIVNSEKISQLLGQYVQLKKESETASKIGKELPGVVPLGFAITPYEKVSNFPNEFEKCFAKSRVLASRARVANAELIQRRDDFKFMESNWEVFGSTPAEHYRKVRMMCEDRIRGNLDLLEKLRPSTAKADETIADASDVENPSASLRSSFPIKQSGRKDFSNGRGIAGTATLSANGVINASFDVFSDHPLDGCRAGVTAVLLDVDGATIQRVNLGENTTPGKGLNRDATHRYVSGDVPSELGIPSLIRVRSISLEFRGP